MSRLSTDLPAARKASAELWTRIKAENNVYPIPADAARIGAGLDPESLENGDIQ